MMGLAWCVGVWLFFGRWIRVVGLFVGGGRQGRERGRAGWLEAVWKEKGSLPLWHGCLVCAIIFGCCRTSPDLGLRILFGTSAKLVSLSSIILPEKTNSSKSLCRF